MVGVYNRKLFRQTPARDQLNRLGGIMASSDDLIQEALRTAYAAPTPSDLGPMRMPAPQPVMQQPRPQMQAQPFQGIVGALPADQQPMPAEEPMMQQPLGTPMGTPMGMEPMPAEEPMMEEMPEAMPPGMPPSGQMAPAAFQDGGVVRTTGIEQAGFGGRFGGGFLPPGAIPGGNATVPLPADVDITAPAGEVTAPSEDAAASAKAMADAAMDIAQDIDTVPPEETGAKIVETAAATGAETSGDLQTDLASIYQQLTGDAAAFEKNIDELNRGIIGAAIAAGTSARATQNIAQGLLVGLQGARETEERRAKTAQALQQAVLQAAGRARDGGGAGSQNYDSPIDAFRSIYSGIINQGVDSFDLPEGVAFEDYALEQAGRVLTTLYTPGQLVGTQFEGLHSRVGAGPTGSGASTVDENVPALTDAQVQDMLGKARAALERGKSRAAVEETLRSMGIDPGLL